MRILFPLLVISFFTSSLFSQTVAGFKCDSTFAGGEVQSCLLAPGLKANAPQGRIVFTTDYYYWGVKQFIGYYDLGGSIKKLRLSNIDLSKAGADYQYGTNDHDLVCMPNGDIILAIGCFSKKDVTVKPDWWNDTYRGNFGPGARSAVMIWRSTDGGENFDLYSIYDPLINGPGYAANPQVRKAADNSPIKTAPWDMGGSDGQFTKVIRGNGNRLFLTFGVFGYNSKDDKDFIADNRIQKTLLLYSDDEGKNWKNTEEGYPVSQWRSASATVRVANGENRLYCTTWSGLYMAKKSSDGSKYVFDKNLIQPENFGNTWGALDVPSDISAELKKYINVNMWSYPVMGNCPKSNKLVVGWPVAVENKKGMQLFLFDPETNKFNELDGIEPVSTIGNAAGNGSAVFHPVMVQDRADAPLLLYWYNLDQSINSYKIRGRIIYNDKQYSDNFDITESISLSSANKLWYGDYHTAGCFSIPKPQPLRINNDKLIVRSNKNEIITKFYPIWLNNDNKIQFSEVSVVTDAVTTAIISTPVPVRPVSDYNWKNPAPIGKLRMHPNISELDIKLEKKRIPVPGINLRPVINLKQ